MPKIILKYKSPEYEEANRDNEHRSCDMPGCPNKGAHKAPKHRGLNDYYYFCYEHVREYNNAWDFFSGMSDKEVQEHMINSVYGDRPTWRYDADGNAEEKLYEAARGTYFYGDEQQYTENKSANNQNSRDYYSDNSSTPEHEAMAIMGLTPPTSIEEIKAKYKKLAKKYHPDLNKNDSQAEELLKKINMAYTILKLAFQEYSKIDKRKT